MTGPRSLCGYEAWGWSLKHDHLEACGKENSNTDSNATMVTSFLARMCMVQSPCNLKRRNPWANLPGAFLKDGIPLSLNPSLSAPAPAVLNKEGNKKQASKAFQQEAETCTTGKGREHKENRTGYSRYKTLGNIILARRSPGILEAAVSSVPTTRK